MRLESQHHVAAVRQIIQNIPALGFCQCLPDVSDHEDISLDSSVSRNLLHIEADIHKRFTTVNSRRKTIIISIFRPAYAPLVMPCEESSIQRTILQTIKRSRNLLFIRIFEHIIENPQPSLSAVLSRKLLHHVILLTAQIYLLAYLLRCQHLMPRNSEPFRELHRRLFHIHSLRIAIIRIVKRFVIIIDRLHLDIRLEPQIRLVSLDIVTDSHRRRAPALIIRKIRVSRDIQLPLQLLHDIDTVFGQCIRFYLSSIMIEHHRRPGSEISQSKNDHRRPHILRGT